MSIDVFGDKNASMPRAELMPTVLIKDVGRSDVTMVRQENSNKTSRPSLGSDAAVRRLDRCRLSAGLLVIVFGTNEVGTRFFI
ncbi:hypothetical protein [Defluviicoccus vanus]|uniref:hypothetical protein n=1 Tax=Defluviicoccus vanus TaxID=111831 RepID=UPI001CBA6B19|nr:hypothetical protein [Defluviicoccus vanus]